MAEMAVIVCGLAIWYERDAYGFIIYYFTTGTQYGIFGGENLASCLLLQ